MRDLLRSVTKMDFPLLIIVGMIIFVGLFVLDSASAAKSANYVMKQAVSIGIGLGLVFAGLKLDYNMLQKLWKHLYVFAILFLLSVLIFGEVRGGARGWFVVAGFGIQPAEYCKVILIVSFAQFLSERQGSLENIIDFIPCFVFWIPPMLLLLKQPDLGGVMVYAFIMFGMMLMAGANRKWMFGIFGGGVSALILYLIGVWKLNLWCPLKTYQLNRFLVLFDSGIDPQGAGYNVIQSKIAIGNGGLFGEGLYMGSQSTGAFLPEQWTDFIFSVFAEELGFIGAAALLILYGILLFRGLCIAMGAKDLYGTLIAAGVVSMYLFHIFENVGMTMGIMPVTGIPLPFVSYGGSSMLTNMMGIALLQNIYVYRRRLVF